MKHQNVFLLTGSNMGDALQHLTDARTAIEKQAGTILQASGIYQTAPWGNTEQPMFLNQVLKISTDLEPQILMDTLLLIEQQMGRVRKHKWEPRLIDIDMLFYDQIVMNNSLQIPHPLLHERRFTLVPLAEIAPDLMHPVLKLTVKNLLENCPDQNMVEKLIG